MWFLLGRAGEPGSFAPAPADTRFREHLSLAARCGAAGAQQFAALSCEMHLPGPAEGDSVLVVVPVRDGDCGDAPRLLAHGAPARRLLEAARACFPTTRRRPLPAESESDSDSDSAPAPAPAPAPAAVPDPQEEDDGAQPEQWRALEPRLVALLSEETARGLQYWYGANHGFLTLLLPRRERSVVPLALAFVGPAPRAALLVVPTQFGRRDHAATMLWDHSVMTVGGVREATNHGAGKSPSETYQDMRTRFASGTFRELVAPEREWADVAGLMPVRLPARGLRMRRVVGEHPNEDMEITLPSPGGVRVSEAAAAAAAAAAAEDIMDSITAEAGGGAEAGAEAQPQPGPQKRRFPWSRK